MNLIAILARFTAVVFAAFLLGLAIDAWAFALFLCVTSALLLLVFAQDYAPRNSYEATRPGSVVAFTPAPLRAARPEKRAA